MTVCVLTNVIVQLCLYDPGRLTYRPRGRQMANTRGREAIWVRLPRVDLPAGDRQRFHMYSTNFLQTLRYLESCSSRLTAAIGVVLQRDLSNGELRVFYEYCISDQKTRTRPSQHRIPGGGATGPRPFIWV